ncbi:MAG: pseudouridine synthase [Pseudomonadota bacterium]
MSWMDRSVPGPAPGELSIVYRDDCLVAVDKPAGLLMHPTPLAGKQEHFLVHLLRDQLGEAVFPVHRLDRPTSGVLLLALDAETAADVGRQFAERAVRKDYLAIVRGWLPEAGIIDHAIADRDEPQAGKRDAMTEFRSLAQAEVDAAIEKYPQSRFSLGLLRPRTGRRHQLRRHMKHLSHPIIGDTTYGRGAYNRFFRERYAVSRLLLHASRLELVHPRSGDPLVLSVPVSGGFSQVTTRFGWRSALERAAER